MFDKKFVPEKPFSDFKWKWACLQCTEGLNDPVILLGVLFRMRKLELLNKGIKYSSDEFARELIELSKDTEESVGVDLARRTGERNLIRNSGQYWRALNLNIIALVSVIISGIAVLSSIYFSVQTRKQYIDSLSPLLSFRLYEKSGYLFLRIENTGQSEARISLDRLQNSQDCHQSILKKMQSYPQRKAYLHMHLPDVTLQESP